MNQKIKQNNKNLCNECPPHIRGKCCHKSFIVGPYRIRETKPHCPYLSEKTGRCTVYNKRFEKNPNCLTLEEMYKLGTAPRDCPYVKDDQDYQSREDIPFESFSEFEEAYGHEYELAPIREEYNEYNSSEIPDVVSTIQSHFCPKCGTYHLEDSWDEKFNIIFLTYKCNDCGHEWDVFKKQLKHTLKLLKEWRQTSK